MPHHTKDSEASPAQDLPLIEAHRGNSAEAPENTIAAFQSALIPGVACIELDVHPASDGTLVVIHDETVDRTTNGSGRVREMAVDALRGLDAGSKHSTAYAGEGIPRLIDVLELVRDQSVLLNIEIKSSPAGVDVPLAVVDLLRRFGKQEDYIVSSFDLHALLCVRRIAPEITLAIIGNASRILTLALRHQFPWMHAKHTTITGDLILQAQESSIRVNVWTVDDPAALPYWKRMGVDKICTNKPKQMIAAAGSMQGGIRQ